MVFLFFFIVFSQWLLQLAGEPSLASHTKLMLWREPQYFVLVPLPCFCLSQPSGLIFPTRLGCFEKWTLSLARLSSLSRSYFISMFVYVCSCERRCSVQSHVPHFRPDGHVHPPTVQRIITTTIRNAWCEIKKKKKDFLLFFFRPEIDDENGLQFG